MNVGDIVCMELILFKNGVDHYSKYGRPCLYIGEKNGIMYFVPLMSLKKKYKNLSCHIEPDKDNKLRKTSVLNLRTIIEKRPQFFGVDGHIDDFKMEDIMKTIVAYFKKVSDEQSKIVKSIAEEYLNERKEIVKDLATMILDKYGIEYVDSDIKNKIK